MVNGISNGSTNSDGKLTLQGNALTSGTNTFVLRNGTNNSSGTQLATSILNPLSLSSVEIIAEDIVLKDDRLPITARINASATDLSGYTLTLSGAVSGNYVTDKYGQVTVYYNAEGSGDKTVTVTAGNWNTSHEFTDYIEYWNTLSNYDERYTVNQGFTKLAQYYRLETINRNIGYVCIGNNSNGVEDWEMSFKVISPLSDVYFDIFAWHGDMQGQTLEQMNMSRQVSFNANDVIKARCVNGTLTVTRNNNSFFTSSFPQNSLPALMIFSGVNSLPTSGTWGSNPSTTVVNKILTFNELTLKEI